MRIPRLASIGRFSRLGGAIRQRPPLRLQWPADLRSDVLLLFQTALALFALTTIIGMIDAQNRLTFSADLIDAHAHAGTLGWLTLGAIAFALLLFGSGPLSALELRYARVMSVLAVVSSVGYSLALLSGIDGANLVFAGAMLLTVVAFLGWLGMRGVQTRLGVAQVAVLLGALVLVFGATVGFLLEVQNATSSSLFPSGTATVHPIMLDAGYLLLIGLALSEWGLRAPFVAAAGKSPLPVLGIIQVALPFVSAVALGISILMGMADLIAVCASLEVVTAAIVILRFAPCLLAVRWREVSATRHYALGAVFAVLYLALFAFVLARVSLGTYASFGFVPLTTTAGIDHVLTLGVLSNALFGLLYGVTREAKRFWPLADDLVFWGMNIGLVGFVVGLFAHNSVLVPLLEGLFSPILGASVLVGIVAYSVRLHTALVRVSPLQDM